MRNGQEEKYISDHPLALQIDGDEIITKLGQWRAHIGEAIRSKILLTSNMAASHLRLGYDVILPIMQGGVYETAYENVAMESGADFYEICIHVERNQAVHRLLERGTWGEAGLPPITQLDIPKIERLCDEMINAVAFRANTVKIESLKGDIEGTYKSLLKAISD
jgi:hypothetical protein